MGTNKIFFPNLDGLRFFAFFAVFLAHSFYSKFDYIQETLLYTKIREIAHAGIFGVHFFFVLSGFLITYLLIDEKVKNKKIDIRNFYIRRILRIWPLYYLIVFIGFVVIPKIQIMLGNTGYVETGDIYSYLFFYNNYSTSTATSAVLGVLWSIAIEEQFYLVWPLLIHLTPLKRIGYLCLSLIIFSFFIRSFWLGYGHSNIFSCISDFAVGGGLAFFTFNKAKWIESMKGMKKGWIVCIYLLFAVLFLIRGYWANIYYVYVNERLVWSLFFAFVILEQNDFDNSFYKWKDSNVLSRLGKYTYGLYMYHFVAIYIIAIVFNKLTFNTALYQVFLVEPITTLIFSIIISYLSYKFFEKPFLKLKDKFVYTAKKTEVKKEPVVL